jgi:hypothetical protein
MRFKSTVKISVIRPVFAKYSHPLRICGHKIEIKNVKEYIRKQPVLDAAARSLLEDEKYRLRGSSL